MKVIPGTQKIYQIQGDLEEPGGIDTNHTFNLYTATLPCSCPNCRSDPSNINGCLYKNNHNVTKVVVSKLIESNQEVDDPYNLLQLTVALLKAQLQAKWLLTNGNEPELRAILLKYLEDHAEEWNERDTEEEVIDVSATSATNNQDNDPYDLQCLTVAMLKEQLDAIGLRKNGNKSELRARLEQYMDDHCDGETECALAMVMQKNDSPILT